MSHKMWRYSGVWSSVFILQWTFTFFYLSCLHDLYAETSPYLYFPEPKDKSQNRLLNIHNQWLEARGELKLAFTAASKDETYAFNSGSLGIMHDNQAIPRFFFEEILLKSHFSLGKEVEGEFHVTLSPDGASVKEGYAVFPLPAYSFLKLGLDRRFFSKPIHYEATIPPLITTMFGHNPDLSIVIGSNYPFSKDRNHLYWKFSLSNGQRLAKNTNIHFIGKQRTYPIFSDIGQLDEFDTDKEIGFGMGFGRKVGTKQGIDILAFSFFSKLNKDHPDLGSETQLLNNAIPRYSLLKRALKRDRHRMGFNTEIQWDPFALWAQYIHGLDGEVKRHVVAIEPSYTVLSPFSEMFPFHTIEFMYGWNLMDVQTNELPDNIPESPFTWDRTTHTFGMKMYSTYFFSWKNEFHLNLEEMGKGLKGVKNNEFLSQITFSF